MRAAPTRRNLDTLALNGSTGAQRAIAAAHVVCMPKKSAPANRLRELAAHIPCMTNATRPSRKIRRALKRAAQTIRAATEVLDELARAARAITRILIWGSAAVTLALGGTLLLFGQAASAELLNLIATVLPG